MAENDDFLRFIKALRPSYKPPSRQLARKLLNDEYLKVNSCDICTKMILLIFLSGQDIDKKAINKSLGLILQMDGWWNIRKHSIINVVVCTPKPYFIKSYNTETESHTAEYLMKIVEEQILIR